jgi:DNA-binding CsgD family transcriptional regulator
LSIVEAAYDIDRPPGSWALELLQAAARAVGACIGVFASVFNEVPTGTLNIDRNSMVCLGTNGESLLAVFERYSRAASACRSHRPSHDECAARCMLTSEIATERQICEDLVADDGHDAVNILATDPNDHGFLMSLAVPADVDMPPATRRDLIRVATHVVAAIRLRARLHRAHQHPRGPSSLTETERSAVTAAARGQSTKEIAYEFGIADATVRVLLMRAARRCGVRSRKELLNLWSRSGAAET